MTKSKMLSLAVVCFYLIAMVYFSDRLQMDSVVMLLLAMLLPLACIWFSDEIAVVFDRGRNPELNPDWGVFVRFMGWVLLLLPAIIFVFKKIR